MYSYEIEQMTDLYHHGIIGQKWGVRRYQNPDGTLTSEGKQRLKQYKNTMSNRVDTRYGRQQVKLEKKLAAHRGRNTQYKLKVSQDMAKAEKSKIASMTYEDMLKEKSYVRNQVAAQIVTSAASTVVGTLTLQAMGTGMAFLSIPLPNADRSRTNHRVSGDEAIRIKQKNMKYMDH